ncbi:MAG: AraC family transcriptional regulator [Ruminococcaceae bacterium]|nr:AraC family transcriptional regulator [Oscillospiraceae bacterium]
MKSKYELHPALMNNTYPLKIRIQKQSSNGYIHWHENLEMLYFLEGECNVINGNEELFVKSGEIVIFNSEAVHYLKAKDNPCKYIIVQLDTTYFEAMGFNISDSNIKKIINDQEIGAILKNALTEQENALPYYQESVKAMMMEVLVIIFRKYLEEDTKSNELSNKLKLIKKVAKYVKRHYDEELTVERISEECGYSRFYISKTFKEITGFTVVWYINAARIEKAKSLLKNGDLSMGEIALQCGFGNQSYFGKVFKRIENISPHEYKAKNRH